MCCIGRHVSHRHQTQLLENIMKKIVENRSCKICKNMNHLDDLCTCIWFWLAWWFNLHVLFEVSYKICMLACFAFVVLSDYWFICEVDCSNVFLWLSLRVLMGLNEGCYWSFPCKSYGKIYVLMIEHCSVLHQSWYICTKYHFRRHVWLYIGYDI